MRALICLSMNHDTDLTIAYAILDKKILAVGKKIFPKNHVNIPLFGATKI